MIGWNVSVKVLERIVVQNKSISRRPERYIYEYLFSIKQEVKSAHHRLI